MKEWDNWKRELPESIRIELNESKQIIGLEGESPLKDFHKNKVIFWYRLERNRVLFEDKLRMI
jgi:hypothetical protein